MSAICRIAVALSLCATFAWAQEAPPEKSPPAEKTTKEKPAVAPSSAGEATKPKKAAAKTSFAPAPSSDPAAVAAFRNLIAKIYRAHEQGLDAVEARVTVSRSGLEFDAKAEQVGPWTIRWTSDHQFTVSDLADKPVRGNFARIVGDLVGFRPGTLLKDRELRLDDAGRVLLGEVPAEGEAFVPLTAFLADKKGRLGTQFIFQAGRPAMERRYFYRSRGESFLVHRTMVRALNPQGQLQGESTITYRWSEIDGFSFPQSIVTVGGNVRQVVAYSQIKPKRRPAPKPVAPAPKVPTDAPPTPKKEAGSEKRAG
jgi:hypothetical protein